MFSVSSSNKATSLPALFQLGPYSQLRPTIVVDHHEHSAASFARLDSIRGADRYGSYLQPSRRQP